MKYENPRQIRVSDIRIQDSFWSKVQNLIIDEVIPYQERILHDEVEGAEKSAAIRNYRIAAGLEKGDVVTEFDGKKVTKMSELQEAIAQHRPGDKQSVRSRMRYS